MEVINVQQGTPKWAEHRLKTWNASDAPVMMGMSPYMTRADLLAQRHSGITPEVPPNLQAIYDEGHRFEVLARPLAEEIVGDDLYPTVGKNGMYGASFDGLTLDRSVAFEHKTLSQVLRKAMPEGCTGAQLPMVYQIQMEQQCMVAGCQRILFVASKWDGDTLVEMRHCWYEPNPELARQIRAGWNQFDADLRDYRPPLQAAPKAVAEVIEALPAIAAQIEGRVLLSNLPAFKSAAEGMIARISTDLQTDQDFANAEAMVKACGDGEKKLDAFKEQALGQTASIDELFRTVDAIGTMLRDKRLALEKLVKRRKDDIRVEIAQEAMADIQKHVDQINQSMGHKWIAAPAMTLITEEMKGKRTVETLRNAASSVAARLKADMTIKADRMLANFQTIKPEHAGLFPDFAQVGNKESEDFGALLQLRVGNFERAQAASAAPPLQIEVPVSAAGGGAAVETKAPPTKTEATAIDVIARVNEAVIGNEKLIRDFIAGRSWGSEREAQNARAILVEYEKFRARAKAAP